MEHSSPFFSEVLTATGNSNLSFSGVDVAIELAAKLIIKG